jgi:hypothetical protein
MDFNINLFIIYYNKYIINQDLAVLLGWREVDRLSLNVSN